MALPRTCPLIGITTYRQTTSWWAWQRDAALVPGAYLDLVVAAGGQPVLLPPLAGPTQPGMEQARAPDALVDGRNVGIDALVPALDGVLFIGGGDVGAGCYGQTDDPRNGGASEQRDRFELALLASSLAHDLPILAICRGHQLLNVALGGDLVQHLPDVVGNDGHQPRPGAFGAIDVRVERGTGLEGILGRRTEVLCSHHQAIGALGAGLVVAARSDDGVVEAVELPDRRFVVGVQWHPEESGDRRLFQALVDEAAGTGRAPSNAVVAVGVGVRSDPGVAG